MSDKVEIKKITLKLGKREVTLSIEEAKNLKEALEELFGKSIVSEEHHHHHHDHSYPYYPYRWWWCQGTNLDNHQVYCIDNNTLTCDMDMSSNTLALNVSNTAEIKC